MNTIARFILRKRRFHTLGALGFAVLFGITVSTQAGSGISVSISATSISASATVGGALSTLAEALLDLLVPRALRRTARQLETA